MSPPLEYTFTEEKERYIRSGKINLFPYNLRKSTEMAKTYSPVKHLKSRTAAEVHDKELMVEGVDMHKELSFSKLAKSDAEIVVVSFAKGGWLGGGQEEEVLC